MFKMSAFSVDTGRQTTPPLVDGVVHNRLVQFAVAPHGDQDARAAGRRPRNK